MRADRERKRTTAAITATAATARATSSPVDKGAPPRERNGAERDFTSVRARAGMGSPQSGLPRRRGRGRNRRRRRPFRLPHGAGAARIGVANRGGRAPLECRVPRNRMKSSRPALVLLGALLLGRRVSRLRPGGQRARRRPRLRRRRPPPRLPVPRRREAPEPGEAGAAGELLAPSPDDSGADSRLVVDVLDRALPGPDADLRLPQARPEDLPAGVRHRHRGEEGLSPRAREPGGRCGGRGAPRLPPRLRPRPVHPEEDRPGRRPRPRPGGAGRLLLVALRRSPPRVAPDRPEQPEGDAVLGGGRGEGNQVGRPPRPGHLSGRRLRRGAPPLRPRASPT